MLIFTRRVAVALVFFALIFLPTASAKPPTDDPSYGLPLPPAVKPRPVPTARWIWTDKIADNQTIFLRRHFSLTSIPKTAPLLLTADDRFTLFVNGRKLEESGTDEMAWRTVHRVNIAPLLKIGGNMLAVRASNVKGAAGIVARLELPGGVKAIETDARWKVNAGNEEDGWTTANFDDASWPVARVVAPLEAQPWRGAGGLRGWPGYMADAPYLAHLALPVVKILAAHPGAGKINGAASLTSGGILTVTPGPKNTAAPELVLDFGREITGRVLVTALTPGVVQIGTGESKDEATNAPWGGPQTLTLTPGQKTQAADSAFRYAHLVFPNGKARPTRLRVAADFTYYPVVYKGSFSCSDALLTKLWYVGAYTAHLCMQEDIWDAPKRDRLRWVGDLHVSGAVINDAFADKFLMEQTLDRLRADAQNGRPMSSPPARHVNGIPGYSCAWVCTLADFYRHLGDDAFLARQHAPLLSLMEYLRGDLDKRGVFANKHGGWPFVDWSPGFDADGPLARASTHFFLIKAAREAAFLLRQMGDAPNAHKYALWANDLTANAQKFLTDGETFGARRQENAMAIFSGTATPEQTRVIAATILRPGSPAWGKVATPYGNNYVLYALGLAGRENDALRVMRGYWGAMLAEGATTTWEGYDPSWKKQNFHAHLQADNQTGFYVSLCHGWSAGPTSYLTDRVLGVRPTSGGFKTVEISPDLGDLDWVEGDVPTPRGPIHLRAERHKKTLYIRLSLPAGVAATLQLPGLKLVSPKGTGAMPLTLRRPGNYAFTAREDETPMRS